MVGGQGGCERRIEVFVKIQQKKKFGGGGVVGLGVQGGSERRIEVFVRIQKKKIFFFGRGGVWGGRGGLVRRGGGVGESGWT